MGARAIPADLAAPHVRRVSVGPRIAAGSPLDPGGAEPRAKLPAGHVRHIASGDRVPIAVTWVERVDRPAVAVPEALTEAALDAALAARDGALWPAMQAWRVHVVVDGVPGRMELPGRLTKDQAVEVAWARISLIGAHARACK